MRNFIYLIIITAIIGVFLKIYFKSDSSVLSMNIELKELSESTIDSILFDDLYKNKAFSAYLGYNYNKVEVLFDEKFSHPPDAAFQETFTFKNNLGDFPDNAPSVFTRNNVITHWKPIVCFRNI